MSNVVDPSQGHPPPIQSTGQRCRIKEIDDEYMVAMTKYYRRFMATYLAFFVYGCAVPYLPRASTSSIATHKYYSL
jgi:hypothetical protein